ncbi:MAG: hypothetical protein ACXV2B_06170 [Halobacteriota archaeon]
MKRIQLIAAALCLVMITTIGAGVVTAKQEVKSNQAGKSSIYLYNVAATDTHGSGKLMINLAEHTFVFNGKGFDPTRTYYLRYTVAGIAGVHTFASVAATPSGNVHLQGAWITDLRSLPAAPAFDISTTSPVVAVLTVTDGPVQTDGLTYYLTATSSTGDIVRYTLRETDYYSDRAVSFIVYVGRDPHLSSNEQGYSLFIPNTGVSEVAMWLYVYDSAGNSDAEYQAWYAPF